MSNDFFRFVFHYYPKDVPVRVDFTERTDDTFLIPVQYFKKLMSSKLKVKTDTQKSIIRDLKNIPFMLRNEGIVFCPLNNMSNALSTYFSEQGHLHIISEYEDQLLRKINQVYNTNILIRDEIYMIGPLKDRLGKSSINGINGLKEIIEQYSTNLKETTQITLEDGSTATAYHIHFYPQPLKRTPIKGMVINSGLQQTGQSRETFLMEYLPVDTNMKSLNVKNSTYYFEIFASVQPRVKKQLLTIYYDGKKIKENLILENFLTEFNKYIKRKNVKFNGKESFKLPNKISNFLGFPSSDDNIIIINNDEYEALLLELGLPNVELSPN